MPNNHAPQFLKLQKGREVRINSSIAAFFQAWLAGTLVGGGPLSALLLWSNVDGAREWIWIFRPLAAAAAMSLVGMILFALPVTFWLRRSGRESIRNYIANGAVSGVVLVWLLAQLVTGFDKIDGAPLSLWPILGIFGLPPGLAAGYIWGRYRMRAIALSASSTQKPNPIHELLH